MDNMHMRSLRLTNFRRYRDFFIDFSDLTVLIGKNDASRSRVGISGHIF